MAPTAIREGKKFLEKKLEKPLDKLNKICYNKYIRKTNKTFYQRKVVFTMAMTYVDALTVAIEALDGEVAEKLTALRTQVAKKHGSSKPTKTQIANEGIKGEILDVLARAENGMTVGEIAKVLDGEYSSAKVTALLTQLKNAGKVVREMDKKVARYSLA